MAEQWSKPRLFKNLNKIPGTESLLFVLSCRLLTQKHPSWMNPRSPHQVTLPSLLFYCSIFSLHNLSKVWCFASQSFPFLLLSLQIYLVFNWMVFALRIYNFCMIFLGGKMLLLLSYWVLLDCLSNVGERKKQQTWFLKLSFFRS